MVNEYLKIITVIGLIIINLILMITNGRRKPSMHVVIPLSNITKISGIKTLFINPKIHRVIEYPNDNGRLILSSKDLCDGFYMFSERGKMYKAKIKRSLGIEFSIYEFEECDTPKGKTIRIDL